MVEILIILVYLAIAFVSYKYAISKWNNKVWEKVIFSLIWPLTWIVWGIYKLHFLF